jgi:hypothetical protein
VSVAAAAADVAPSVEQVVAVPLESAAVVVSAGQGDEVSAGAVSAGAAGAEAQGVVAGSEAVGALESAGAAAGADASAEGVAGALESAEGVADALESAEGVADADASVLVEAGCEPEPDAPSGAGALLVDELASQAGADASPPVAAVEPSEAAGVAAESVDVVDGAGSEGALVSDGAGAAGAVAVVDESDAEAVPAVPVAAPSVAGADVV